MGKSHKVLLVSNNFDTYKYLKVGLNEFEVILSIRLKEGIELLNKDKNYCLIIIEQTKLKKHHANILTALRRSRPEPIMVISEPVSQANIAAILNYGADAYQANCSEPVVLVAQARALIRRYTRLNSMSQPDWADSAVLLVAGGRVTVDVRRYQIMVENREIKLTRKEFELFYFLVCNPGIVMSQDKIYERVWHSDATYHCNIRKSIARLRNKIEPDPKNPTYIKNVRGFGYYFIES